MNVGYKWYFAGAYGPNADSNRKYMWEEMLACVVGGPLAGDVNITCFPSERSGDSSFSPAIAEFFNLIFQQDLVNLPLAGGTFTWSNGRVWSRLDRFIVSSSWEATFSDLCLKRLPRLCSDYPHLTRL